MALSMTHLNYRDPLLSSVTGATRAEPVHLDLSVPVSLSLPFGDIFSVSIIAGRETTLVREDPKPFARKFKFAYTRRERDTGRTRRLFHPTWCWR